MTAHGTSESRDLPTTQQIQGLCELMSYAFGAIRFLGRTGAHEAAADLADALHNMPVEMFQDGVWDWGVAETELKQFESQHIGNHVYPFSEMLHNIRKQKPLSG